MHSVLMGRERIGKEDNDQEKGDKQKVAEASCADEHGGRTVRQQARDRGNAIIRAQFSNVISGPLGVQERMPQDGLHNSEGSNDYDENHIYEEKMTQLLFGIEQGIAYKQQGNIVKKEFQAQNPVRQIRRGRIKDLHHSKPDKQKDRQKKRGPERRDLSSPIRQKKRELGRPWRNRSPCCCPGIFLQNPRTRARSGRNRGPCANYSAWRLRRQIR